MNVARTRQLVAALLVVAVVLFALGSRLETSAHTEDSTSPAGLSNSAPTSTAPSATHDERDEVDGETNPAEAAGHVEAPGHDEATVAANGESGESGERLLGIDTANPALVALAVALSLAAAVATLWSRHRLVALAVATFAAVFGVLDLTETIHAFSQNEPKIAVIALLIAVLHLTAAGLAIVVLLRAAEPFGRRARDRQGAATTAASASST